MALAVIATKKNGGMTYRIDKKNAQSNGHWRGTD
nr:MAG TPA: hypothetical protein [Caudoviricetes sp.]